MPVPLALMALDACQTPSPTQTLICQKLMLAHMPEQHMCHSLLHGPPQPRRWASAQGPAMHAPCSCNMEHARIVMAKRTGRSGGSRGFRYLMSGRVQEGDLVLCALIPGGHLAGVGPDALRDASSLACCHLRSHGSLSGAGVVEIGQQRLMRALL